MPDVRFEDDGVEQVPTRRARTRSRGRVALTRPFSSRSLIDSRITVRETPNSAHSSGSVGSRESTWIDPGDDAVDEMSDHGGAQPATNARSDGPKRATQLIRAARSRARRSWGLQGDLMVKVIHLRICNSYDEVCRIT